MDLSELQRDLHVWRQRNFPASSTWYHQFLGMVEETGELSHAILKQIQGIRGSYAEHETAAKDAVGDLLIYTMGFCSDRGWDMQEILFNTAKGVLARDWVAYPQDGMTRFDENS